MIGMRMHGAFLAGLVMNIQDAYALVVQDHPVMHGIDFRRVLRFLCPAGPFFFKNRTYPGLVETQTEAVFLRELLDLCFSMFFVQWPDALQFVLVNCTMSPFTSVQ